MQHTRSVEKKTAKGGKCKVKDDQLQFNHYLDALRNFQMLVCKQNLISSTAHTVRTVHNRTIGLTAFDTKQWLCEHTIRTHSRGHKDTMSDSKYMDLVNDFYIVECVTNAGVFSRNDLPGTSPLLQG